MSKLYDNPDYWFSGTPKRTKKSKSSAGVPSITSRRSSYNPKKTALNTVRSINKKVPQVVVKISGSSKGVDKAQAHASYIGRNGKVELEDQDGNKYKGSEQKHVMQLWAVQGMHDKHSTGARREAFHFVFSMPNGTNPEALKQAVQNLVEEEFQGHQYFMAQHLDTDSPHCHVIVNATNEKGERLNPRKADLHNYRVNFAHKLREQGVEATATRKIHRFKYKDNIKQGQLHKYKRTGKNFEKKRPTAEQMKNIKATHKNVAEQYKTYANTLTDDQLKLKNEIKKLVDIHTKEKSRER